MLSAPGILKAMRAVLINPEPKAGDPKWFVWAKMLCEYQQQDNADAENDLKANDSKWTIKQKLLKAINNAG